MAGRLTKNQMPTTSTHPTKKEIFEISETWTKKVKPSAAVLLVTAVEQPRMFVRPCLVGKAARITGHLLGLNIEKWAASGAGTVLS